MLKNSFFFLLIFCLACNNQEPKTSFNTAESPQEYNRTRLVILGTLQDGGLPHIGCKKSCCTTQIENPDPNDMVVSLGIIDPSYQSTYLFEATPDLSRQLHLLNFQAGLAPDIMPSGVFATHAHIGHYTGLQYFGKESKNANQVPVYAMPRMQEFLSSNGPWDQLVRLENIQLRPIINQQQIILSDSLTIIPFRVPHRDEYSETVGFKIIGPNKSVLFIPDIDKWSIWSTSIIEQISQVDYAFLDGTFYHGQEIGTRDISQIPHPFIQESMELFKDLSTEERAKIHFIHFNHTNPVLNEQSEAYKHCIKQGFNIAKVLDVYNL